jgi:hypothetical protein
MRGGMGSPRLRILIFPETPRMWTARLLEHDLAAAGRTEAAALDTLLKVVQAHIAFDLRHGLEPLAAFAAAPRPYWMAFAGATRMNLPMKIEWGESASKPVFAAAVVEHPLLALAPTARIA